MTGPMTGPVIRPAVVADTAEVALLEADNLGADAWSYGLVAEGVSGNLPTVIYLAAEVDGHLAGYAAASIVADIAELQRIAVGHPHRRTGLASALLDAVVTASRAGGANRLLLEVRDDNVGALCFYADRGFVEIDRRQRYYHDGGTAVVMRLPLVSGCG